jgi:hypothetical protein
MFKRGNRLRIESLERREMMAGDVAAVMSGGDLHLTEAVGHEGADQCVMVSQLSDGRIRVFGNWAEDSTQSTVNGQAYQDFTVTGSLFVDFDAGKDLVMFDSGVAKPTFNEVHIDVGAATATGDSDNDDVIIWGAITRGSMFIDTGAGDDWVYITDASIGDPMHPADLVIRTGSGVDGVDVKTLSAVIHGSLDIQTYESLKETDNDRVLVEDATMTQDLRIRTGGGNDDVWLNIVAAYDDIEIETGDGHDKAKLEYVTALDDLMARMGDGFDNLELNNVSAADASLLGELGHDNVTKSGQNTFGTLVESSWEFYNGRRKMDFFREDFEVVHAVRRPFFKL